MSKLHAIFAASALGLLVVTGAIVMYDYVRGWKWFQWEFMRIQQERLEQNLAAAKKGENRTKLAELARKVSAQELTIARHREQYVLAQKNLEEWEGKHYAADEDYRFAKAKLDAKRYQLETAIVKKSADRPRQQREFDEQTRQVNDLQLRLQAVTRSLDAAQASVDAWMKKITDAESGRKDLLASVDLIKKQLAAVVPSSDFFILNAPMLDFIAPTFKIDQVVLPDLFVEMNYMSVPRVDRCQTCHRAIDRPGFESKKEAARLEKELQAKLDGGLIAVDKRPDTEKRIEELRRIQDAPTDILNPFRTHPRLDLFVGSASPHPLLEYGCTACHRGQDRATEFGRAGHTPASPKMEHRWASSILGFLPGPWDYEHRHWGYEPNPFLDTPMYPRQNYEAGCLKCHASQVTIRGGEQITKATAMVELYGCYACHKIDKWRFTDLRKPGPDLTGIAEKTTPEWAMRWISEPHDFRSTTRMPSFFYQRNMIGPTVPAAERAQNIRYQNAEIQSIVAYLFDKSTRRVWPGPAVAGDPARGQKIVDSVGCLGCHVAADTVKDEKTGLIRPARRDDFPLERNYGFNLVGVGTKTNADWIYNWVRNPKAYYPEAPMPSLRLTEQEASDVTAYLMTLQKPQFMARPVPAVDPQAVHDLAKSYLINTLSDVDAEQKLKLMPMHDQLVYLGQRSIEKYGCYSCHNIRGFEGLKPIGTELTIEGSKALHLFDFGFVHAYKHANGTEEHVDHTVPSWVYNKLRSPRVYDDQRTKSYNDKLKMPNFHLSREEARLITTVVLGLTKEKVAADKMASGDAVTHAAEEARKLISQHNCRACHVVDGYGRAIATQISDANFLPPDLSPEGKRAQSRFLFNFLKDPTTMRIRPWLSVRMPTFHFSDAEANTLVAGFAAEGKEQTLFDNRYLVMPPAKNVAIGREVFAMLRCSQCHSTTPVNPENPPAPKLTDAQALAPNLTLARVRLRYDWIPDWIRRPNELIPGTRMPTNFPRNPDTGGFQSPLAMAIDTPAFASYKAALLPLFGNDEKELRKTMGDAVALTDYLRDYIWSIGITQMRLASPQGTSTGVPQPVPQLPPPTPALRTGRVEPGARSGSRAGR